jgi:membrane protease YdiL (CAAX protease family)
MDQTPSPSDSSLPLPAAKPISRFRWGIHVLIIAAYPIVAGVLGTQRDPASGAALSSSTRGLLIVCALHLLFFGCIFGLAWLASRASADQLRLRWRPGWFVLPLGVGYSIALRIAVGVLVAILVALLLGLGVLTPDSMREIAAHKRPNVEAVVDVDALRNNPAYFWLTLTLVSFVVAGFTEELWRSAFIGGLGALWPTGFGSRIGQFGAVAIASICFGLGHMTQGWIAVGLTTLLGMGLGAIMVLHGSIWPAVIAHGAFDATSFGLLPFAMEQLKQLG